MRKVISFFSLITVMGVVSLLALHASDAELGRPAPNFTLTDIHGEEHSLSDYEGKYVVLEWINHGCPFVKKHYNSNNMQTLQKDMKKKDVVWLSICSSAVGKQGNYSSDKWKKVTKKKGASPHAILLDPSGKVGKMYGARTTPHMFVINPKGSLIYMGAIDDKPSTDVDDIDGAKNFVAMALYEAMEGKKVTYSSTRAYGCSVKYK